MYSEDMAEACVFIMNSENEVLASSLNPPTSNSSLSPSNLSPPTSIINIGTGQDITIRELTELIAEVVGYTGEIRWDTTKPDGMPRKLLDVSVLQSMGWSHKTSLENGLRLTYKEFLENQGTKPTKQIKRIEKTKHGKQTRSTRQAKQVRETKKTQQTKETKQTT